MPTNRQTQSENGHDPEKLSSGGEYVTRYQAEKLAERIMTAALAEYERIVVEPRHEQTQAGQTEIKAEVKEVKTAIKRQNDLIQRGTGMVQLAGFLGALASVLWIVLQIHNAVTGHPITIGGN